MLSNIILTMKM